MNDHLEQLLKNLQMKRLLDTVDRYLKKAQKEKVSYEEFLTWVLQDEYHEKKRRSLEYRIRQARLPTMWTLETFPFKRQPGVHAASIKQLGGLDFLRKNENIIFIGDTGAGKTGLSIGLLIKALENGYRALFIKAQDLFDDMLASLADRSTRSLLNRLMNVPLLCIDELGYLNLRPEQTNIFFRLMDERYGRRSTIITTNLDFDEWYAFLGNKRMVASLLERMRHYCHTIRIEGPSLRELQG